MSRLIRSSDQVVISQNFVIQVVRPVFSRPVICLPLFPGPFVDPEISVPLGPEDGIRHHDPVAGATG